MCLTTHILKFSSLKHSLIENIKIFSNERKLIATCAIYTLGGRNCAWLVITERHWHIHAKGSSCTPESKLNEALFLPCSQRFGAWCVWISELIHIHNATMNNCALQPDF